MISGKVYIRLKEEAMINLGLIDVLLVLVLLFSFFYSVRTRYFLPFSIALIVVLLIELERLVPGSMTALGNAIHSIDAINEQLPHIQISPIVTIQQ
jgi:hypothetical protein